MSNQNHNPHAADDLDARIAAERKAASLYTSTTAEAPSAGPAYQEESRLNYFIRTIKANPKLAIPLIVAPILLISLISGFAVGNSKQRQLASNEGLSQVDTDAGPQRDTADPVAVSNDARAVLVTPDSSPTGTTVVSSSSNVDSSASTTAAVSDQDGDGVADDNDDCQNNAGSRANRGCPVTPTVSSDQDGDGVADRTDYCPQSSGPSSNRGCPVEAPPVNNDPDPGNDNTDEDKVDDSVDACPTEPGTSQDGCPLIPLPTDQDGDGVLPPLDACPTVKGPASNKGCPLPKKPTPPKITKIITVIFENHSYSQMLSSMPTVAALGKKYGYAKQYYGKTHPSLPNYITMAAGSTMGVKSNSEPSKWKVKGPSIFGQAIAAGKTAKVYAEGMKGTCGLKKRGEYEVKHNPWPYFVDPAERAACKKYSVPFTAFAADARANQLPNVGMVVPTGKNNGHDASLKQADKWFKANVWDKVANTDDFKSGRLALIITADEDNKKHRNNVLTVVVTKSLENKHKVVSTKFGHPSLTRLYAELVKAQPLREGKRANSIMTAFNLPM